MPAPNEVINLVEHFQRNLKDYQSGKYNETQVRLEFIDPFFEALGWDVHNKKGYAEAYKDVVHEDQIKVGGATKAPDYGFRIGGMRKFFVEAKKPSISIKEDIHPAYQVRRYAWSAKLPLSILTDFEELAVYDCRIRPMKTDKTGTARVMYFKFNEYVEEWGDIADIFSRDAVLQGSFDKYAESTKRKRGTTEVDTAFLEEIERWRESLARNIALRNSGLTVRELNFAVQRTIDRIIFLRIAEDRGLEPYGLLRNLSGQKDSYTELRRLYIRAEERYNSGLFHFKKERDRQGIPDEFTVSLKIDDKVLKKILLNLYYPDSPYEFSVLPAEILGHVYEQFLGKVIRLTSAGHAKVEDKPEVKKAGGVFYTPTYIVDYIVEQTVGKLMDNSTPKDAEKLKICDPACGSGSFLLGAYQYLLHWHRDFYVDDNPKKWAKAVGRRRQTLYQGEGGEWRLTTPEKRRILLNNIYGVDIDPQAVEVTKLSLLLKVLEGENEGTLGHQLAFFQERALPDLDSNIKCGNSLIGSDFYSQDGDQLDLFDTEEMYRINAFDWDTEFPEIKKAGGFNVIIGNPPYVDIKALPSSDVDYVFRKYQSANNRVNLFACFIEKSLDILYSKQGRFSMIVPTAILTQESYNMIREIIGTQYRINNIVRLPNESFGSSAGDVKVDTVIMVISSDMQENNRVQIIGYKGYDRISTIDPNTAHVNSFVSQSQWMDTDDYIWSMNITPDQSSILEKCEEKSVSLEYCVEFSLGITPYDKYKGHTQEQIKNKVFHADIPKDESFKKLLAGNDVRRYEVHWNGDKWISYGPWLGAPRQQRFFTQKRILVKQIIDWTTKRIWATIANEELYNTQNAFNLLPREGWSLEYILGILNSHLMTFYHRKKFLDEFKMRFQKVLIKDCKRFPIHTINFDNSVEAAKHDKTVKLVESILKLNKSLVAANSPTEKQMLERQIEMTDKQIDSLVYKVYGLTEEEIRIVEES